ncbi:MAG: germination protein YpeB [Bacillota bacterium]
MRRWWAALLVLALLATAAWGFWERNNKSRLAFALEANYQREFYETLNSVEQVEVLLAKTLASDSPRQNIIYLTEVWHRATGAQQSLAQLPFKNINMAASRKFLSQVGDYSYSVARAIASGEGLNDDHLAQLNRFHTQMGKFGQDLHGIEARIARGGFRWIDTWVKQPTRVAQAAAPDGMDGFINIDKRLQELPTLVYDGPFSDHLENRKPQGLKGPRVNRDQAVKIAGEFVDQGNNRAVRVDTTGEAEGVIPAWSIVMLGGDRERIAVDVSKEGGHVVWFLNNRTVGQPRMTGEEALDKAKEFLSSRGYEEMAPTYSMKENNVQTIVFAAKEGDVILYPDQVKVKVALDNGQVVGFDGIPYLMSHREREMPESVLTEEEARKKVSGDLKVEKVRKALIPLDTGKELLTYEVKASLGGDAFLIYINAITGQEESIRKVIELPGGQLVL